MLGYHLSLYLHLLALVAASATSGVVHLAHARAARAVSVAEAKQWHALEGSTARIFPIATLVLFATGAYMVSVNSPWSWSTGWVVAGLVAVAFLMGSGAVLGARGARVGRTLAGLGVGEAAAARAALNDPFAAALGWSNTGVALATVLVMTLKTGLVASLAVLALGAAAGVAVQLASGRKVVTAAPARAEFAP